MVNKKNKAKARGIFTKTTTTLRNLKSKIKCTSEIFPICLQLMPLDRTGLANREVAVFVLSPSLLFLGRTRGIYMGNTRHF